MRLVKLVKSVETAKMETIRPGGQASEISQARLVIVYFNLTKRFLSLSKVMRGR